MDFKTRNSRYCLQETHLGNKDKHRLKQFKGCKTIIQAYVNQEKKKSGTAIYSIKHKLSIKKYTKIKKDSIL